MSDLLMIDPFNNYHNARPTDIELATKIGQGLLSEVRRMQTILSEHKDTVCHLEQENQENQNRITELKKQVRFKCQIEEKLKQDIWDLELVKQDLHHQVCQLSSTLQKTQADLTKRQQQQWKVQQELEKTLKQSQTAWETSLRHTQDKYETQLSQLQDKLAQITAERDTLLAKYQSIQENNAALMKKASFSMQNTQQHRLSSPFLEQMQTLESSLAQAHERTETLQIDLLHEKQKRQELEHLLRESQETIEQQQLSSLQDADTISSLASSLKDEMHQGRLKQILPVIMHTMLGEWCQKYTRLSKSHLRFFWIHPYTKTLYWSSQSSHIGGEGGGKSKSVLIESFSTDNTVIIIQSPKRNIKIQCLNKESHKKWVQALKCLLGEERVEEKNKRLSLLLETSPPTMVRFNKREI